MLLKQSSTNGQRGAALIVSLVVLSVVTVLGIASMRSANTELKLASGMRDRGVAFEAAEAALAIVEKGLSTAPPSIMNLVSDCYVGNCYTPTCDGGLCFDGDFDSGDEWIYCEVASDAINSERVDFWDDTTLDVWNDTSKHKTVSISGVSNNVKYITEFLCFVKKDPDQPFNALTQANKNNGSPLYRVTVLAKGDSGRSTVSLQSTYKAI